MRVWWLIVIYVHKILSSLQFHGVPDLSGLLSDILQRFVHLEKSRVQLTNSDGLSDCQASNWVISSKFSIIKLNLSNQTKTPKNICSTTATNAHPNESVRLADVQHYREKSIGLREPNPPSLCKPASKRRNWGEKKTGLQPVERIML